jgi:hypothetical protein
LLSFISLPRDERVFCPHRLFVSSRRKE